MSILVYGANGYTGRLIARLAVERGLKPILAGRNERVVAQQAQALGLPYRSFGIEGHRDPADALAAIRGVTAVLNCAGPFSWTAERMAAACVRARAHYLDITGEIEVFEALAACDAEARAAGVMLLPGCGFDVVPSDCLAAHLKRRLPSATSLRLAFQSMGRASRGTSTTVIEHLGRGGVVRRNGRLTRVPPAWRTLDVDFGRGPRRCVSIPWGDVATAYRSTGIPNIEVYMAAPRAVRAALVASRAFLWLLRAPAVKGALQKRIQAGPPGPTDEERARNRCYLWGEARDDAGGRAAACMETPEGYTLTALAAVACLQRVMGGAAPAGYQTPATAYGPDFVLGIPGVKRSDVGT